MQKEIRFAILTDSHLGQDTDFICRGVNSFARTVQTLDSINTHFDHLDFVIHLGDLVFDPDESAYGLAQQIFSLQRIPVHFLAGNHDDPQKIRALFHRDSTTHSPFSDRTDFHFTIGGVHFIGLDATDSSFDRPVGFLTDQSFDFLQSVIASTDEPFCLFTHFPPLALDCQWIDADMLIQNGNALHEMLKPHASRVAGVFFGHVHRSVQLFSEGILYVAAAATSCQFNCGPADSLPVSYSNFPPTFYLVTLNPMGTLVKQYWPETAEEIIRS